MTAARRLECQRGDGHTKAMLSISCRDHDSACVNVRCPQPVENLSSGVGENEPAGVNGVY